ncbi:flagellar hook-length control protein FliK [Sphingomonas sp. ST-64]|uniref:Flagellar hook-length control protein FliK n=1 Tax=Sphingomonas plantiphila TaxID=3163295 RepID=A0ABW8YND2_9SPHN
MRPDAPAGLYETMMVPFLQPVSIPAFVGEGQISPEHQQPVTGLPAFATLLGSAAPILPVAAAEAAPETQALVSAFARPLLMTAETKASAVPDAMRAAEGVTPLRAAATQLSPLSDVPETPDSVAVQIAPDRRSAYALPIVDSSVAATAVDAPLVRHVTTGPIAADVAPIQVAAPGMTQSADRPEPVGASDGDAIAPMLPIAPTEAVDTMAPVDKTGPIDPVDKTGPVDTINAVAASEPIVIDPARRPILAPSAADPEPAADAPAPVRVAVDANPQPPVDRAATGAAALTPPAPADRAPAAALDGLTAQQRPVEAEQSSPKRPCTVSPKTAPVAGPPAPPNDQPVAEIKRPISGTASGPEAPMLNAQISGEGQAETTQAANDDSAAPIPNPVVIDAVVPQPAPAAPVPSGSPQPDALALVAEAPLPDSVAAPRAAGEPAAPAQSEGIAPRLATPAPQDVASVGDAPAAPEAQPIGHAAHADAQRSSATASSQAGRDHGEGGRQPAAAPAVAPAPATPPASAPVVFSQLIPDTDPLGAAQPAEPRARAAAVGEDVAVAIVRHVEAGSDDLLVIRLDPGELGRIEVRLKVEDGQRLSAELTADQPATLDLLRRDSDSLSRALNDAGFRTEGQSLRFDGRGTGQGGESGFGQQERRTAHRAYLGEGETAAPAASVQPMQVRSAGRIDLFA